MHWQACLVEGPAARLGCAGGAAQPAGSTGTLTFGLVIGNVHIIQGDRSRCTMQQKKIIVKEFLNVLSGVHPDIFSQDLPVARVIVGDVNLSPLLARDCTQDMVAPVSGLFLQGHSESLGRWRVSSTAGGLSRT